MNASSIFVIAKLLAPISADHTHVHAFLDIPETDVLALVRISNLRRPPIACVKI